MKKTFENWLVVSDIDGTLNNKLRRLPKRNYESIKKFTEAGGNFTLASGRLTSSLKRNYDRVTPNQPAIVLNGAGIYDFNKEKCFGVQQSEKQVRNSCVQLCANTARYLKVWISVSILMIMFM